MERVGESERESKREKERVWCCVGRQGFDSVGRGVCARARERARKSERKRERECVCVCCCVGRQGFDSVGWGE